MKTCCTPGRHLRDPRFGIYKLATHGAIGRSCEYSAIVAFFIPFDSLCSPSLFFRPTSTIPTIKFLPLNSLTVLSASLSVLHSLHYFPPLSPRIYLSVSLLVCSPQLHSSSVALQSQRPLVSQSFHMPQPLSILPCLHNPLATGLCMGRSGRSTKLDTVESFQSTSKIPAFVQDTAQLPLFTRRSVIPLIQKSTNITTFSTTTNVNTPNHVPNPKFA